MPGIQSIATYLPSFVMKREVIAAQLKWFDKSAASAKGQRTVANWDEDAITMAVAAARQLRLDGVNELLFASTSAPFQDRSNVGVLGEALSVQPSCVQVESSGSQRAATSALLSQLQSVGSGRESLLLASDRRAALLGSSQEMRFGDGAAAVRICAESGIAEFVDGCSLNADLVDHYRAAQQTTDYALEDRWVRDMLAGDLVPRALQSACASAACELSDIDQLVLPLPQHHAKIVIKGLGLGAEVLAPNLFDEVGDTGAGHALIMLDRCLQSTSSGKLIALVGVGQGVDVILLRTTQKCDLVSRAPRRFNELSDYLKMPVFSRQIALSGGIRAEADKRTAMSAYYRNHRVINSMMGSSCNACGTPHFPAARVCVSCHKFDDMAEEPFAHKTATIKSFTEDWQTATPAPPMCYGNVEFEGGGNAFLEMTDVLPSSLAVGAKLDMQFRVKDYDDQRGFRRYFWKPRPLLTESD